MDAQAEQALTPRILNVGSVAHQPTSSRFFANGQSAAADAEGKASVARERVERIKRGENVEGGLGKPLTWEDCERIFRECGLTKSDMEHCRQVGQVSDVFGFETMLKAIHEARERAERNTVRKLQSRPLQHQRPWSRQTV